MAKTSTTTSTETNNSEVKIPDWVEAGGKTLIGTITDHMKTPYQTYGGKKVAGITGDERTAFDKIRGHAGSWNNNMLAADGMIGNAVRSYGEVPEAALAENAKEITTGRWDGAAADRYMNPYLDRVLAAKTKALQTERDMALRDQSLQKAKTGSWGGARHGVADGATQGQFATALENSQATAYNDAWDKAMVAYAGDEGRALDAGKSNADNFIRVGLANQSAKNNASKWGMDQFNAEADRMRLAIGDQRDNAKAKQDLAFNDADALFKSGLVQRDNDQMKLDSDYEEWSNGQNKIYKDAGMLSTALGSTPHGSTTTSTGTSNETSTGKNGGNTFSKILGGALSIGSMFSKI